MSGATRLIDVSNAITAWPGLSQPTGRVAAFVGHPRYTAADDVARGVVSREYLATIETGVAHWESEHPGFAEGFRSSTVLPAATKITSLRRVDAPSRPADGLESTPRSSTASPIDHRKGWLRSGFVVADPRLVRVGEGQLPTNADEVAIDPFLAVMALAVGVVGVANAVVLGVWGLWGARWRSTGCSDRSRSS